MAKESTYGTMDLLITENGTRTRLVVEAYMSGQMAGDTKVNGRKTTCMEEESTLGKMAEGTKEST